MAKIHTLQEGYQTGDLSVYPEAIDNKETLYEVKNNASTKLRQSLSFTGNAVVVESTSQFPDKGIIKVSSNLESKSGELIYYSSKTSNTFKGLVRGFAGSVRSQWNIGSSVSNTVSAEHHNSIKDAILKIETNLGLEVDPNDGSLNGILKSQENRFLITKPIFRGFPLKGPEPLTVRFQNFSTGPIAKYFWDFGDGNTSSEKSPIHTYRQEGTYTVELNVISVLGGQGVTTKYNYVLVSNDEKQPFFYVTPMGGNSISSGNATLFEFVDQTDGDVKERVWNFGSDGHVIKNMYRATHETDTDYSYFYVDYDLTSKYDSSNKIFINSNQNLIKNIIDISYNNQKTLIKVEKINDSLVSPKIGLFEENLINQYTEVDPNIHIVYFIYKKTVRVSPSILILFKNQTIKKSFLKEELIIL